MVNFYISVYKSFHAGGFNILKLYEIEISEMNKNDVFNRRISFDGKKIDFFSCAKPDKKLVEEYDKQREISAMNIVESGGDMKLIPESKTDVREKIYKKMKAQKTHIFVKDYQNEFKVSYRFVKPIYDEVMKDATK
jgi:ribosomal protein S24E